MQAHHPSVVRMFLQDAGLYHGLNGRRHVVRKPFYSVFQGTGQRGITGFDFHRQDRPSLPADDEIDFPCVFESTRSNYRDNMSLSAQIIAERNEGEIYDAVMACIQNISRDELRD